jgi:hypothetical protein
MSRVFLDGYVLDSKTKILIDSSIRNYTEPIYLFLKIVSKTTGAIMNKRTIPQMMNRLKSHMPSLGFGKKQTLTMHHRWAVQKRLFESGYLDFIPENLRNEMTDTKNTPLRRRNLIFFCALGILYMFRKDMYAKKRPLRYNIPQEST